MLCIIESSQTGTFLMTEQSLEKQSNRNKNQPDDATLCIGRQSRETGNAIRLSKKERRVDALALRADERRDKLRKAAGRSKYPMIRGSLNGGTHMERLHVSMTEQAQAE